MMRFAICVLYVTWLLLVSIDAILCVVWLTFVISWNNIGLQSTDSKCGTLVFVTLTVSITCAFVTLSLKSK